MNNMSDRQLMTRAAWFYYVAGLNQEATSRQMGLTRARVNKLLGQARDTGLVSITINDRDLGLLHVEEAIQREFGLDFCITTPALDLDKAEVAANPSLAAMPLKAVATAGAMYLRDHLADHPKSVVGTGWGRTLAYLSRQMSGTNSPDARFISLMGSLTANSAFNPFEVVQALAQATGGEGYFLPVPFIADSPEDRDVLMAQRAVARPLNLAKRCDIALISVGELTEESLLRRQGMISREEMTELRAVGAVGDTNGLFFNAEGKLVDHDLTGRTIGASITDLARFRTVLLSGGLQKVEATRAVLRGRFIRGLIIDGDSAVRLADGLL
jgi:DNA-binding transcriptional regulator LsrR (DeoR family)